MALPITVMEKGKGVSGAKHLVTQIVALLTCVVMDAMYIIPMCV